MKPPTAKNGPQKTNKEPRRGTKRKAYTKSEGFRESALYLPEVTSIVIPEPEQAEPRSPESNAISVPTAEFTFSARLTLTNSNGVPNNEPFVGTSPPANFTVRRYSQRLSPNQIGAVANEHVPNTRLARLLPVHTVVIEPVFPTVPQQTHEAFAPSIYCRSSDPIHGKAQTINPRGHEPPTSPLIASMSGAEKSLALTMKPYSAPTLYSKFTKLTTEHFRSPQKCMRPLLNEQRHQSFDLTIAHPSHTNMSMALPSARPLPAQPRSRSISVVALIAEKGDKRLSSAVRIRSVSCPPSYVFPPH